MISGWMTKRTINSSRFNRLGKIFYYIQLTIEKFIRSWVVIFLAGRFDLIFLQRTTFPLGLERLVRLRNPNIIFDIDDSIYMPDSEESGVLWQIKKWVKEKEVISILKVSKRVIAENNHIKRFVLPYCKTVDLIAGPIDEERNYTALPKDTTQPTVIGWIGSPSTTPYLRMLDDILKQLNEQHRIKVRLIGASDYSLDGLDIEIVQWQEQEEVSQLHKFDIGIMPMPDNEWTRGKVGCKMLQYMANAIPTVVSYTPTNAEVVQQGMNGFLANSQEEWIDKLSLLIKQPHLREKIGRAGRRTVEEKFSLDKNVPRYIEIFKNSL